MLEKNGPLGVRTGAGRQVGGWGVGTTSQNWTVLGAVLVVGGGASDWIREVRSPGGAPEVGTGEGATEKKGGLFLGVGSED